MTLVVGYDRHPANRAAVLSAGELAGALNVSVHLVDVADLSDTAIYDVPEMSAEATQKRLGIEREPSERPSMRPRCSRTYRAWTGDPVTAPLKTAEDCAATLIVVGRPPHGIGAALGRMVTDTVARNLVRHGTRPVAVVPEFADDL